MGPEQHPRKAQPHAEFDAATCTVGLPGEGGNADGDGDFFVLALGEGRESGFGEEGRAVVDSGVKGAIVDVIVLVGIADGEDDVPVLVSGEVGGGEVEAGD